MGKRNREERSSPVCRPTRGKPPVVRNLLRVAFTPCRSRMYSCIACPYRRDHNHLQQVVKTCCCASRSLSCLGLHCHCIKCRGRSPELKQFEGPLQCRSQLKNNHDRQLKKSILSFPI